MSQKAQHRPPTPLCAHFCVCVHFSLCNPNPTKANRVLSSCHIHSNRLGVTTPSTAFIRLHSINLQCTPPSSTLAYLQLRAPPSYLHTHVRFRHAWSRFSRLVLVPALPSLNQVSHTHTHTHTIFQQQWRILSITPQRRSLLSPSGRGSATTPMPAPAVPLHRL